MVKLKILLLLFSGVVALGMGEAMARVVKREAASAGVLLLSSRHIRLDERGAVRHVPHERLRMVAVYGDTVEFDVFLRTNNLGLVDHRDYDRGTPRRRSYAFVGDSFVYGMGAEPWVPTLRDALRSSGHDIEIYNLGVNGASILHYRKLLVSVAKELPITHVVVMPITNDFYRPWWVPTPASDGGIQMCQAPPLCDGRSWAVPIDEDMPIPAIVERAGVRAREVSATLGRADPSDPLWKRALWRSELYLITRRAVRQSLQRFGLQTPEPSGLENVALLDVNLDALAGIRADFPTTPVALVHFPQKEEVESGAYRLDLGEAAATLDIQYFPALTRCTWSLDMYHALDGHPNANGYANMATCLTDQFFSE